MIQKSFSLLKIPLLICAIFITSLTAKSIEVEKNNLFVPSRLGEIKLFHDENGFYILKNDEIHDIQNCFVDKELRNISNNKLAKFLGQGDSEIQRLSPEEFENLDINSEEMIEITGAEKEEILALVSESSPKAYIAINQMDTGEYSLRLKARVLGGGVGLCWVAYLAGKGAVYGVSWTIDAAVVVGVTAVAGPVAGAVAGKACVALLAGPTEVASNWVGIAAAVVAAPVPLP